MTDANIEQALINIALIGQRVATNEAELVELKKTIRIIQNRPPLWATWLMTTGAALIGSLITWLLTCLRP